MGKASDGDRPIISDVGRWARRWQLHRTEVAKVTLYAAGIGNLALLVFGAPTALTLSVAVLLAPFSLAMALQLTAVVACGVLGYALSDSRDRALLLVRWISTMLPRRAREDYREGMSDIILDVLSNQVRRIARNLVRTAPRTILQAWVRLPRPLWTRPLWKRWRRGARR